ncbi:hypothetical protein [Microbulbifer sp. 2205BS26-8]|uniref:hypothetical protein n=1 Tax=Microbulbifer sp. 2205BS26-8 TaxID=3064386 RepID=UPI00273DC46B|nr:hypothetical protein [Microbulbifer sp. 2205BS26-8]MDP5209663.1 hypothetical protein [Microbulbifer sp. 2205BS26-8]
MKSILLFLMVLSISGLTPVQAAETPALGEIAGLLFNGQGHTGTSRTGTAQIHPREWVQLLVNHGDTVEKGQRLAVYKSSKGRAVIEYIASRSGRVMVHSRAALDSLDTILEIITVSHEDYCAVEDCTLAEPE